MASRRGQVQIYFVFQFASLEDTKQKAYTKQYPNFIGNTLINYTV